MAEEQRKSLLGRAGSHLVGRIKAILPEIFATVTDKVIPQGAAELSQALYSQSNAYVPYGAGQRSVDVVEPIQAPKQSYEAKVQTASKGVQPKEPRQHYKGMETGG